MQTPGSPQQGQEAGAELWGSLQLEGKWAQEQPAGQRDASARKARGCPPVGHWVLR